VNQREALAGALSYFQTAGPLHTADEEDSLFPRLRAAVAPEVRQALLLVELLERDHHRADGHHARVEVLCHRWMAANALSPHDLIDLTAHLTELHTLYRAHIDVEDHDLFPLAARVLTPATVQAIGREMAARRRVRTSPVAE
jgi:hemerythrin-like domain-containing protein